MLHEWNLSRKWKADGWQHYELDLKTWGFEGESFVPMELLLNGKVYSIVTDQGGGNCLLKKLVKRRDM